MSAQEDYLRCLEQLASTPPKRAAALIRSLLSEIEGALRSGRDLKGIWEAHFMGGDLSKAAQTIPDWAAKMFSMEIHPAKQRAKPGRDR